MSVGVTVLSLTEQNESPKRRLRTVLFQFGDVKLLHFTHLAIKPVFSRFSMRSDTNQSVQPHEQALTKFRVKKLKRDFTIKAHDN